LVSKKKSLQKISTSTFKGYIAQPYICLVDNMKRMTFLMFFLIVIILVSYSTFNLFVANFGCGRSGYDILNNVLEKSPIEIQSRVRGVYFDPKSCDLPLSGLTFINSALDAKTAARFVTAGIGSTSSFWTLKVGYRLN
jgi:hypothetical protein